MTHIEEWKRIRNRFSKINTDEMRFRVECIDELIMSTEKKEEKLEHFK